jgi:SAM-dependent methyltransferase
MDELTNGSHWLCAMPPHKQASASAACTTKFRQILLKSAAKMRAIFSSCTKVAVGRRAQARDSLGDENRDTGPGGDALFARAQFVDCLSRGEFAMTEQQTPRTRRQAGVDSILDETTLRVAAEAPGADVGDLPWWSEEYDFFGDFYMEGDDSKEGYLEKKQSLRERTIAEVDGVEKIVALKPGARILDCPCGYGRHSVELARRGYVVTGSDLNSVHLGRASDAARALGLPVRLNKESMIDLKYRGEFDAVINMFYSFGFFDTDAENEQVLRNFFDALRPGGRFLMHTNVNIPRIRAGKYKTDEQRSLSTGNTLRIIDRYDEATKRIEGEWIIRRKDGKQISKLYSVRVYTREEFESMCRKVGFSGVATYGDWTGGPYSADAEDMMVVAAK